MNAPAIFPATSATLTGTNRMWANTLLADQRDRLNAALERATGFFARNDIQQCLDSVAWHQDRINRRCQFAAENALIDMGRNGKGPRIDAACASVMNSKGAM